MKSMVIYFSRTGENYNVGNITKGNTEVIAEYIKEFCDSDLFKCESLKPYSDNYQACVKEALYYKQNNVLPVLKKYLTDVNEYQCIFIGGPIYFGEYPYEVYAALDKLDLTNKIIKPFVTHEGSGLANVMKVLKTKYPQCIIKDGLAIKGSEVYENSSKEKVKNWANI